MIDHNDATAQESQRRPLDEIAADIDALDERIRELNSERARLTIEHDEAASGILPKFF